MNQEFQNNNVKPSVGTISIKGLKHIKFFKISYNIACCHYLFNALLGVLPRIVLLNQVAMHQQGKKKTWALFFFLYFTREFKNMGIHIYIRKVEYSVHFQSAEIDAFSINNYGWSSKTTNPSCKRFLHSFHYDNIFFHKISNLIRNTIVIKKVLLQPFKTIPR